MINPIKTKSYKEVSQVLLNRNLSADYLLASLLMQDPNDFEDVKIGEIGVHAKVENDQLVRLVPYVTFTPALAGTDMVFVSYDGYMCLANGIVPQAIVAPQDMARGQVVHPGIRYCFGATKFEVENEAISLDKSQSFIILDDMNISNGDKDLTLKTNFRIDNKDNMITLLYAADSIINPGAKNWRLL